MAKRTSRPSGVLGLYADHDPLSGEELLIAQQAARDSRVRSALTASTRPDMAGAPVTMMVHPLTYQQRVLRMWDAYALDPFFHRMVNRAVEFAANGSTFEMPGDESEESWLDRVVNWFGRRSSKAEREETFCNKWAETINVGVPNTIPGLQEIVRWACKHLLLSGMFVPAWELGTMRFGKQEFIVPIRLTCYPCSAVTLRRERSLFMEESVYLKLPKGSVVVPIREGEPRESTTMQSSDMQELPMVGDASRVGDTEAFALKFNWSPGDLVSYRVGPTVQTGQGVYPQPPFFGLLPQFIMRQKLFASDLAILDGVINYIMMWQIGDKDNPPQPPIVDMKTGAVLQNGTIAQVRKMIQEGRIGPAMELFVPYYVNLQVLQPDPKVLLNETKYIQSTIEIFQAFGIFFSRSATGSRERMERINITNFEEFLGSIRHHVSAFIGLLTSHIVELNAGKLTGVPIWSPNPLNTKTDAFIEALHALMKVGRVSIKTLLRHHGLDDAVELRRIAGDLAVDADDLTDANVPTSYVQKTVGPPDIAGEDPQTRITEEPVDPNVMKTSIPPTRQPGRPKGTKGKKTPLA